MKKANEIELIRGHRIEVGTGKPGYRWIQGWTVVDYPLGSRSMPMPFREAQAEVRRLRNLEKETVIFHRVASDSNGNPRYVCGASWMLTDGELRDYAIGHSVRYARAISRANQIGGRKFHNKQFGGGLVFTEYSLGSLIQHMSRLTGRRFVEFTSD